MSGSMVPIIAAVVGSSAAHAAAAKAREEEEKLTKYNSNDLDNWEFKIIRSSFGRFNSQENIQKVCTEEAAAGWELVEKFDNHRLRFKRRTERRGQDIHATIDPYRSCVGSSGLGMKMGLLLGGLLTGALVLFFAASKGPGLSTSPSFIMIAVAGMAVVGLGIAAMARRK
ncbi:MAG: hypothetical protein V3T31_10405 [candidate division Zixibacteria bacterium]